MVRLIPPVATFKLKKENNRPTVIEINWGKPNPNKHNFVLPTLWMKKLQEKTKENSSLFKNIRSTPSLVF